MNFSISDSLETRVSLREVTRKIPRKNPGVSDIWFTSFNFAFIFPTMVLNQKARMQERENMVFFKRISSKAGKTFRRLWCSFSTYEKLSENHKFISIKKEISLALKTFENNFYSRHAYTRTSEVICWNQDCCLVFGSCLCWYVDKPANINNM